MKKTLTDWKFLLGLIIANLLIYFSYDQSKVFWYIITGTMLFLIAYSILNEDFDDELSLWKYLAYGLLSGILVYGIFWFGNSLIHWLDLSSFENQVNKLYDKFSPEVIWHYIVLVLIIIPGEEIFWRGFVLKRLLQYHPFWISVISSAILYAIVQLYSGYFILSIAALVGGIVWGALMLGKKAYH